MLSLDALAATASGSMCRSTRAMQQGRMQQMLSASTPTAGPLSAADNLTIGSWLAARPMGFDYATFSDTSYSDAISGRISL